ncbi:hypothetical protein BwSH20_47760 [Bradyrhizobium ottawaense]|nr:hypothetical protein BwSG20_52950 [Bradyrhizobium ottawaense]GMP06021.1 hypothetical protein BwSH20_47760 [Bradyrhizobium ottawaense]
MQGMKATFVSDKMLALFAVSLGVALLFSLLADPVVRSIGLREMGLSLGVAIAGFGALAYVLMSPERLTGIPRTSLVMMAMAASFLLSALIGLVQGDPPTAVIRSTLPYLMAFLSLPLAFAGRINLNMIGLVLAVMAVGLIQALYQIILFMMQDTTTVTETLVSRITMIDARVTLPLAAAGNGVALALIGRGRYATAMGTIATSIFGLAALVTLTRTLVIVYALSFIVAIALWTALAVVERRAGVLLRNTACVALSMLVVGTIIMSPPFASVPPAFKVRQAMERSSPPELTVVEPDVAKRRIETELKQEVGEEQARHTLEKAESVHESMVAILRSHGIKTLEHVAQRYADHAGEGTSAKILAETLGNFSANLPGAGEIGGGRISDEWRPALQTYLAGNPATWAFGIGAGTPFTTKSGEPRTYIHNLPLYLLLYNGAVGLVLNVVLQIGLIASFFNRVRRDDDAVAFACLSMVIILNCFALLFAVHKLIGFNLILAVIHSCFFVERRVVHVRDHALPQAVAARP